MLAEELVRRGHEVVWWSSTHSHQQKELVTPADLDIIIEPGMRLVLLDCGSYTRNRSIARYRHHKTLARRFLKIAKEEPPPDIIVASFPTIDFADAGVKAAKKIGCDSVIDIRDPWPDVAYNLYSGVTRMLAKLLLSGMTHRAAQCLRNADILFACSSGFLDWGLEKAGRSRRPDDHVYYIGRPAEDSQAGAGSPSWLSEIPHDKQIVTFVGAFGQVYELDLVCDVARRLAGDEMSQIHFVLAGDGDKGPRIRALASDLPNVTLPGWIPTDDVRRLLDRSLLGLAPYRQLPGCMPNKIFEYMALGLPIISSLEGDLPNLLQEYHAGFSYTPGDGDTLIACLRNAVANTEELALLSHGALRMFNSKFIATEIYSEYATHLERLVDAA